MRPGARRERVLGIHTHERESSDETRRLSNLIAGSLGITTISEEIDAPARGGRLLSAPGRSDQVADPGLCL